MNPILKTGSAIVTLALISYSIGVIAEQKTKKPGRKVLFFLTMGIILDISATACMIIGSTNSSFTLHGLLGYTALLAMIIDTSLIWRLKLKNNAGAIINRGLHLYSFFAYAWWVIVYITGGIIAMAK